MFSCKKKRNRLIIGAPIHAAVSLLLPEPRRLQKIKRERKATEASRRQKLTESRKHLASVRVVQKNLVFVVGLGPRLADTVSLALLANTRVRV